MARSASIQRAVARVASLPAPVGGWNARDSLANMKPTDAALLENWFPGASNVVLRGGYTKYSTGIGSQVETLMAYSSGTTDKLFAIAGGSIYDCTGGGAVGAAVVTGLSNSRWEWANITTPGGSFLIAVNGADAALLYDGATWTNPAITGVSSADLDNVTLFKSRLWFHEKNTLKAWYLPTLSIGGAAESQNLNGVARMGGKLIATGGWTVDAGYGVDDNLVFVTSNGEVVIYRGTDPASAATWALIGVWSLGAPVGNRCMIKYGGDVLLLTTNGLFPLAKTLQTDRVDPTRALTDKIDGAIAAAATALHSVFGWQVIYTAHDNAVVVNVPVSLGLQEQFVMNTITGAWTKFTGWAANCWAIYTDNIYFGGNGFVGAAFDDGYADDGADIPTQCLQAFNYFGGRGQLKRFTRARPNIFTNGRPDISIGVNVDYDMLTRGTPLAYSPVASSTWDTSVWDTDLWGGGLVTVNNWQGITGMGYSGALRLASASQGIEIEWAATDLVFEAGWAGI